MGVAIQEVYSIEVVNAAAESGSLVMRVLDKCKRPSTETLGFILEDGAWRITHVNGDSTKAGKEWFHAGLNPIKTFAHVDLRNRERYMNESNLGKTLGLDVKNKPCKAGER